MEGAILAWLNELTSKDLIELKNKLKKKLDNKVVQKHIVNGLKVNELSRRIKDFDSGGFLKLFFVESDQLELGIVEKVVLLIGESNIIFQLNSKPYKSGKLSFTKNFEVKMIEINPYENEPILATIMLDNNTIMWFVNVGELP